MKGLLVLLIFLLCPLLLTAQEWQWSVKVPGVFSQETNDNPRAFLWIPPDCRQVRAVVVGQHNMLEEGILEHPVFRQELAKLGIAEVWVTPGIDFVFDFEKGAGEQFNGMLEALAKESGYQELAFTPVVPIGHSAAASYPWNFAAWSPDRTLAAISIKGDAPLSNLTGSGRPNPDWGSRTIAGVPGLMVIGEYEWMPERMVPALAYRAKHPAAPVSLLTDAGRGHFDISDELVQYLALFIRKAAHQRLPAQMPLSKPATLKPIDPQKGWLADRWRTDSLPQAPAAPYAAYTGNTQEAFWYFDKELAEATETHYARVRGKKPQLLGLVQHEMVLPQNKSHAQVSLQFIPLEDGISFRVGSTFLDTVPAGHPNPAKWTKLPAGSPIGHASGPVSLSRITGPLVQTGPETFRIQFYRMGMNNPKRSNDIWLLASHPGDKNYKSAVQQANLKFPLQNKDGAAQHITFPVIPNQQAKKTKSIELKATSDAGVPVQYYVREGPAVLEGNTLKFTKIPPRAKYPVKVTVVAWQYGRSMVPKLQSAEQVERTFYLLNH
ncbi:hypothetical protein [Botryobacter ruber]|uniref:hypothetical protein n=1 Tax=Botryobacter ruber TaxID=2171629 RepID=UPI000E0C70F9|nr:hypothetical protein [Botryobacter ruber]